MKSIYITVTQAIDIKTKRPFKELWIHFKTKSGKAFGVNLNPILNQQKFDRDVIEEALEDYKGVMKP